MEETPPPVEAHPPPPWRHWPYILCGLVEVYMCACGGLGRKISYNARKMWTKKVEMIFALFAWIFGAQAMEHYMVKCRIV